MERSEQVNEIAEALATAQTQFTVVPKTKTAKVKMKSGGEFSYKYADLADCLSMALPILGKNGIAFSQPHVLLDGKLRVCTLLIHKSGQWMRSDGIEISEAGDPQQFGGEATYFRRYDACSFIGVAPDEDTDAQNQPSPKPQPKVNQTPAQPKVEPRPNEKPVVKVAEAVQQSVQKTDNPLPTADELKKIQEDVREWAKKVDKDSLIAYIRKTANQEDSKKITKTQWAVIFDTLKQAELINPDKLKELVEGKSE